MHLHRLAVHKDVDGGIANEVRCRHIRIAEAEVKDILCTDLRRSLLSVFEDRADGGLLCAKFIHLFRDHIVHSFFKIKDAPATIQRQGHLNPIHAFRRNTSYPFFIS